MTGSKVICLQKKKPKSKLFYDSEVIILINFFGI